jgi:hypothetical protein
MVRPIRSRAPHAGWLDCYRPFQWIPGEETPIHRADAMERALRHRRPLKPPTHEAMQERYDPWGRQEATSLFKEVDDSAETAYHSDMYVT